MGEFKKDGEFTGMVDADGKKIYSGSKVMQLTIVGVGSGLVSVVMHEGEWCIFSISQGYAPLKEMLENNSVILKVFSITEQFIDLTKVTEEEKKQLKYLLQNTGRKVDSYSLNTGFDNAELLLWCDFYGEFTTTYKWNFIAKSMKEVSFNEFKELL